VSSGAGSISRRIGPHTVEGYSARAAGKRSGRKGDRSESGATSSVSHTSRSTGSDNQGGGGGESRYIGVPQPVTGCSAVLESHVIDQGKSVDILVLWKMLHKFFKLYNIDSMTIPMSCDSPENEKEEYRESGPPGRLKKAKKCGGCKGKGKKPCAKCAAEAKAMKEDALTTKEYLAACDLGVEHKSRTYIRARLDAMGKGKKCGGSSISAAKQCNKGSGGQDMSKYSAKGTAKRAGIAGAITGAVLGAAAGGGLRGAARGAVVGGAVGAAAGAARAGINRAGRAWKRAGENIKKAEPELLKLEAAYQKNKNKLGKKAGIWKLSKEEIETEQTFAAKVGNAYDKHATNVWSNANEKKYKRGETPYDKARKAGKAR